MVIIIYIGLRLCCGQHSFSYVLISLHKQRSLNYILLSFCQLFVIGLEGGSEGKYHSAYFTNKKAEIVSKVTYAVL